MCTIKKKSLQVFTQTTLAPVAGYTILHLQPEKVEEVNSEIGWCSVLLKSCRVLLLHGTQRAKYLLALRTRCKRPPHWVTHCTWIPRLYSQDWLQQLTPCHAQFSITACSLFLISPILHYWIKTRNSNISRKNTFFLPSIVWCKTCLKALLLLPNRM